MKRWLTIALGGLVLSCQGPAAVMAQGMAVGPHAPFTGEDGQTASTVCSIAPKIEWCWSSSISMRTVSPAFRNEVSALPRTMVSTVRNSAMQE